MAYQITPQWQAVSVLTGYAIGQQLSIQNAGRAGDLIELIISDTEPATTDRSYVVRSLDPVYRVSGQTQEVWVRYVRYDLNGTITPEPARRCLANITDNEQIAESSALPVAVYTEDGPAQRIKVSTVTRQELQIVRAQFFVGSSKRIAVPINDTHYSVLIAPADKYLVIEDVIQTLSFTAVTDGIYKMEMCAYVDGSATSSFTYTPASPLPIGRPMISSSINSFPTSTVDVGVIASAIGDPEYPLTYNEFYIDSGGNRNTLSQTLHDFFSKNRQVVLAPNGVALVRVTTTGTATGTADIGTTFFTSEISIEDAPKLLGIIPS
jgi:hypothetical protein